LSTPRSITMTKAVSLGESRYGTPEPQIALNHRPAALGCAVPLVGTTRNQSGPHCPKELRQGVPSGTVQREI
jgi:hypothetical protein